MEIRELVSYESAGQKTFGQLPLHIDSPVFDPGTPLDRSLDQLIDAKFSMGLVVAEEKLLGVLTAEDILEKIIQKDIDA